MKWLPVPSVPRWTRLFVFSSRGYLSVIRLKRAASVAQASTIAGRRVAPANRCRACRGRRRGRAAPPARSRRGCPPDCREGRSRSSEVRAAIMPQPMSTPTAAGITAPLVGITEPTVAPMPTWTSGIAATCLNTNGILRRARELLPRLVVDRHAARPHLDRHAALDVLIFETLLRPSGPPSIIHCLIRRRRWRDIASSREHWRRIEPSAWTTM